MLFLMCQCYTVYQRGQCPYYSNTLKMCALCSRRPAGMGVVEAKK